MSDIISGLAGLLISLAASYLPGFAPWYHSLSILHKRLVMLGASAIGALLIAGAGCAGLYDHPCTTAGLQELATAFGVVLVATQTTYLLTAPKSGGNYPDQGEPQ